MQMTTAEATTQQSKQHDPRVKHSLKHSIRDGAAYSVMTGAGESYFSAFAVFLKASTAQIGFLASMPSLLASFAQLFSAWLGHRYGKRKALIMIGASLQAFIWLPLMFLPILYPDHAVELLIGCIILYHTFGNLAAPQWSSLMGELVTEHKRGRYFAKRTAISSMVSFIALVAAGLILHYFGDAQMSHIGFIVIFIIAVSGRLTSLYHLTKMYDPPGNVAAMELPFRTISLKSLMSSQFVRYSSFFALVQFSVYIASPFFAMYLLRDLEFSYLQFMACSASTVLFQFIALQRWGRISDIFGNRIILNICGLLIPLLPFLWLLSGNFYYLLVVQAFGGFIWAGFSLSASNSLYDLIPQNKRATYMAIHNVLCSTGLFFGALLGGWLGTIMPDQYSIFGYSITLTSVLYNIFVLSFLLRLATMLVFIPKLQEKRKVRRVPITNLIFRVIAFNPLSGFKFEVTASRKAK
jgi:MFS family permease